MTTPASPSVAPNSLAARMGDANAFNTIRLLAAVLVIFSHGYEMTGVEEPLFLLTGQSTLGQLSVAAFFVISGFLISQSYTRSSLKSFTEKRARRIMPGLIVSVLLLALVMGPLVSALSPASYFGNRDTWKFLGQMAFLPGHTNLPGVFTDHPTPAANGSLWSLRFEVACYVAVPLLLMLGRMRTMAVAAAWLVCFAIARPYGQIVPEGTSGAWYYVALLASMFRFFGAGMMVFLLADRIPARAGLAWAAFALCIASAFTPFFIEVLATAGAYALFIFAYGAPAWFRNITAKGDISYGVYIYGFPVQQLVLPLALGLSARTGLPAPTLDSLIALPFVVVLGVLSWLLVEKPMIHFGRRRAGKAVSDPVPGGAPEAPAAT